MVVVSAPNALSDRFNRPGLVGGACLHAMMPPGPLRHSGGALDSLSYSIFPADRLELRLHAAG